MRNRSKHFTVSVLCLLFLGFNSACGPKGGDRQKSEQASGLAGFSRSGGYELSRSTLLGTCPFISDSSPFNFDGILGNIRTQLETKINGQDSCRAKQQFLSDSFTQIQRSFALLNQEVTDNNSADMYQNFIGEMQLQMQTEQAKNPNDAVITPMLQSGILSLQERIRTLEVQSQSSHDLNQAALRLQMFSRMNDMLISLGQTDPKCVEAIGGWQALLPPLLGTVALASGHSILSGQILASSALQLVTSLTGLLQTQSAKQAFQDILRVQNEKVLACTYYSIQHSSCEVKRALKLIEEKKPMIKNIAFHKLENKAPAEWQKYLNLYSKIPQFEPIFNAIATQGSSLSLDVNRVGKYFGGLTVNLDSLKPYPDPQKDPESVLNNWLERARRNGMRASETDNFGKPLSIKEQFQNAMDEAQNIELTIQSVESNLKASKSFEGLKHSLGAMNPELAKNAGQMKDFLLDQASALPEKDRGAVYLSAKTMESLENFMSTGINGSTQKDVDTYVDTLTTAGSDMFRWISMGSVAQLPKQQILALGGKAQERLRNAFQVIENRLSKEDIDNMDNNHVSFDKTFTAFKQEHLLYYQLADLYDDLKGPHSAFRQSEMDIASGSFEKGFEDELIKMVESKLDQPSGAHFCSLMSGFLQKGSSRSASRVFEKCQEKFKTLEISTLSLDQPVDINYKDACFYDEYIRRTRSFQILDWLKRGM